MTDIDSTKATCGSAHSWGSKSTANDKVSPLHGAGNQPDPLQYVNLVELEYNPHVPRIPWYCNTVLDCACQYGSTSLAAQFGWNFARSCEFWKDNVPLTEEQRKCTILDKRFKMIGLDPNVNAVTFSVSMNIIDEGIVQSFDDVMSEATKQALRSADVWIMQQCMSYMPSEHLKLWINEFLHDRTRPKRFIYDFNPVFDKRNMHPLVLFGDQHMDWEVEEERYYGYRKKTEHEYHDSEANAHEMCVWHYVIDFNPPVHMHHST